MKNLSKILLLFGVLLLLACTENADPKPTMPVITENPQPSEPVNYKYMALGDSYTIGQSVCENCRFPEQLKSRLETVIPGAIINLDIIAQTGWTTTNLKTAISAQNPTSDYDLVTLLIGVNNQYQHKPFSLYETEFPELLNKSIALAKGDKSNVIVISIPDYRYTPYGNNLSQPETVSQQIDQYNNFAAMYCAANNVVFVNITDITRLGLENPELVATDGLHPSALAYAQFAERILPEAMAALAH